RLDPSQAPGAVSAVATNLGNQSSGIAFDGARIWTADQGGSVSIVTPAATIPWTVTIVTPGVSSLIGMIYHGADVWVTDGNRSVLLKLAAAGGILETVTVGQTPSEPIFDGTNIWVPNQEPSVAVVRASSGAVLATLTGNGLNAPWASAFDGRRLLVTNL